MKNLPLLFCGIFFTLAFSWVGIVLSNHLQIGGLQPTSETLLNAEGNPIAGPAYLDANRQLVPGRTNPDEPQYPLPVAGEAAQGKLVYIELGCLYCHTQQVRRRGFGADFERGWGDRQTVARDYIRQERVLLGTMRTGPDLMTVGQRIPDATWHLLHLYNPRITSAGSLMPPHGFLFETRPISPLGPSPLALNLPPGHQPPPGREVIPNQKARHLVAYLLSLRLDYDLPEARREQP